MRGSRHAMSCSQKACILCVIILDQGDCHAASRATVSAAMFQLKGPLMSLLLECGLNMLFEVFRDGGDT